MEVTRALIIMKLEEKRQVLKASQSKVSLPIIERICRKMELNLKFPAIHISNEGHIIDGHHRYVSSVLTDYKIEIVNNYPKPSKMNEFDWNSG